MARKKGSSGQPAAQTATSKKASSPDVYQAVVVADSFDSRFAPLTQTLPRCLMPLVNMPMLEYTLEALQSSGIDEVFLYCRAHADKIRAYLETSPKWTASKRFRVKIEHSPSFYSVGDVLRDVDAKGYIDNVFMLVHGDLVCNVPLKKIIEEHKARMKTDSDAIVTSVLRPCGPFHRSRDRCEGSVFFLDPSSNRILDLQPIVSELTVGKAFLPADNFSRIPRIDARFDLFDCHIDICSIQVWNQRREAW